MIEKKIGKIRSVKMGLVGYQDQEFGLSFDLGSDSEAWGVGAYISGGWAFAPSEHAKWTLEEQSGRFAQMSRNIIDLLKKANVDDVTKLKNIPVEVEFNGSVLENWRILEEAL